MPTPDETPTPNIEDEIGKSAEETMRKMGMLPELPPFDDPKPAAPRATSAKDVEQSIDQLRIMLVKSWRQQLDLILQDIKASEPSRERAISITKLQEAIMWLGMDLKRLGTPSPYPEGKNPNSPVVEPTADGLKL